MVEPIGQDGYFDARCEACIARSPSMLVPWYLMASLAYYWWDTSLLSDGLFDKLCQDLAFAIAMDELEHMHLSLIDPDELGAGTCSLAEEDFPSMVHGATRRLLAERSESGVGFY